MAQPALTSASPAPSTMVVRPPEGIARGKYEAPPWAIASAAGGLIALVMGFFIIRHRRNKNKKSYESITPPSSRSPTSSRR
jgi:hypothetical protein